VTCILCDVDALSMATPWGYTGNSIMYKDQTVINPADGGSLIFTHGLASTGTFNMGGWSMAAPQLGA
jgi:hypothetical protein